MPGISPSDRLALAPATASRGVGAVTKISCDPTCWMSVTTDTTGTVSDERRLGVMSGSVGFVSSTGERVSKRGEARDERRDE